MSHTFRYPIDAGQAIVDVNMTATEYFESYLHDITLAADAVATVASADASDLATAITLVNELKTQVNELLANLRSSGKLDV